MSCYRLSVLKILLTHCQNEKFKILQNENCSIGMVNSFFFLNTSTSRMPVFFLVKCICIVCWCWALKKWLEYVLSAFFILLFFFFFFVIFMYFHTVTICLFFSHIFRLGKWPQFNTFSLFTYRSAFFSLFMSFKFLNYKTIYASMYVGKLY